jgi:pimeloyl-ACP methyl ester carboxylesterase
MNVLKSHSRKTTTVLFVHGMGRTPWSSWPILLRLRSAGMLTPSFGYMTSLENFASIRSRLAETITSIAATGDYVLVGHSLGGVLIRAALNSLPDNVQRPRHVFLLGSPITPSRLAQRLKHNYLFKLLAGDCGQLLSDPTRMASVGTISDPTVNIVGTSSLIFTNFLFEGDANDGVVAVSEASANWFSEQITLNRVHALLPSSREVAAIIVKRMANDSRMLD